MPITFITHNGKPLREGGRMLAVQAQNTIFCTSHPQGIAVKDYCLSQGLPDPTVKPEPVVQYGQLWVYNDYVGCSCCASYHVSGQYLKTDVGLKYVFVCRNCKNVMRSRFH